MAAKTIYRAHNKAVSVLVWKNRYALAIDGTIVSPQEVLKMFPNDGESILNDQLQAVREIALSKGWKDTAKSTIDDYKGE